MIDLVERGGDPRMIDVTAGALHAPDGSLEAMVAGQIDRSSNLPTWP
jgi:hypothetical protein